MTLKARKLKMRKFKKSSIFEKTLKLTEKIEEEKDLIIFFSHEGKPLSAEHKKAIYKSVRENIDMYLKSIGYIK